MELPTINNKERKKKKKKKERKKEWMNERTKENTDFFLKKISTQGHA